MIKRNDEQSFRNFIVKIDEKFLIERNENFHSELSEWIDGVSDLMKKGSSYFSADVGFTPFTGTLVEEKVNFETVNGSRFCADFFEIVSNTIVFLYEQSFDDSFTEKDIVFFKQQADSMLAGMRFRFKTKHPAFLSYLKGRELVGEFQV